MSRRRPSKWVTNLPFNFLQFLRPSENWKPFEDFPGSRACCFVLVFVGGLGENAIENLRDRALALQKKFPGEKPGVRIINLAGHTGSYFDLLFLSRFLWWLLGVHRHAERACRHHKAKKAIFFPNSTGALAFHGACVYDRLLSWLISARHSYIAGFSFPMAPAYRLCDRRHEVLLALSVALHWVLSPASMALTYWFAPTYWASVFCLVLIGLHFTIVPLFSVPYGETREEQRREVLERQRRTPLSRLVGYLFGRQEEVVLSAITALYLSLPIIVWFATRYLGPSWVWTILLSYFVVLMVPAIMAFVTYLWKTNEPRKSVGYYWMGTGTARSLIRAQFYRYLSANWTNQHQHGILAERDTRVRNDVAKKALARWDVIPGAEHADWNDSDNESFAEVVVVALQELLPTQESLSV